MPADPLATQASARDLAAALPSGTRVLTSPLQRCSQLARELVRLRPDLSYGTDARLAEMDFGHWEGWRWDDIPKAAIDAWTADFGQFRFGGRESVQELMDRVAAAWAETRDAVRPTVWVTHAGVVRAAMLLHQGTTRVERSDQWPREAVAFGDYRYFS
jgi:alpha-ribazole phosphatase